MKRLSTWDTYVSEAKAKGDDRSVEVPLSADEVYRVDYPTRRQGRMIVDSQLKGDTDGVLVGLLGEDVGERVKELAEDHPAFVLDEFLLDVMRAFGMIPDDSEEETAAPAVSTSNGRATKGRATKGKAVTSRKATSSSATKRTTRSARSSAASS